MSDLFLLVFVAISLVLIMNFLNALIKRPTTSAKLFAFSVTTLLGGLELALILVSQPITITSIQLAIISYISSILVLFPLSYFLFEPVRNWIQGSDDRAD